MRVALDCTAFLVRSAGVKAYVFQLHKHLRKLAGNANVVSFPFLDHVDRLDHEGSAVSELGTFLRMGLLYSLNIPGNHGLDLLGHRVDLFHASNQVRNAPRNAKLTTMIHDMTAWTHPELHTAATVSLDHRFAESIVKRADGIITPSESSRQDAIRILGLNPERVRAIHHGVGEAYFAAGPAEAEAARARYGLTRPYVLFVSTIEPRKNLDRLIEGFSSLTSSIREEFELVVAGPAGWHSESTMARLASGAARYLGYVPEEVLPGLTAGATLFAYPSLYEGFGFPVAQAMAAGTPVLTSGISSLPEIAQDAAIFADPLSVNDLRGSLEKLLLSPDLRSRMSVRGREVADRYRWERCARETWEFFELAAAIGQTKGPAADKTKP